MGTQSSGISRSRSNTTATSSSVAGMYGKPKIVEDSRFELSTEEEEKEADDDDNDDEIENEKDKLESEHLYTEVNLRHSQVGTPSFMAPETINKQTYNRAIDWWAMGVTVYECYSRERLFSGKTREEIFKNVTDGNIDLSKLDKYPLELGQFVHRLLERDSRIRLGSESVNDIKEHEYFYGIRWDTISTDDAEFLPPHQNFSLEEASEYESNRKQFYGEEDPLLKGKIGSKGATSKKFKKKKKKKTSWNFDSSISRETIREVSEEDVESADRQRISVSSTAHSMSNMRRSFAEVGESTESTTIYSGCSQIAPRITDVIDSSKVN